METVTRRQERGARRMESILDAAAALFADRGYEQVSTNAIAAAAGISPGSLYQFYASKEAIAEALAMRYGAALNGALDVAFDLGGAELPMAEMVARIVDVLVAVNIAHPGLKMLFRGPDAPPGLRAAIAPVQAGVVERVERLVGARAPGLLPMRRLIGARVMVEMFRALLPLILVEEGAMRGAYVAETKKALLGYALRLDERA